jgi:hypothetical protein
MFRPLSSSILARVGAGRIVGGGPTEALLAPAGRRVGFQLAL